MRDAKTSLRGQCMTFFGEIFKTHLVERMSKERKRWLVENVKRASILATDAKVRDSWQQLTRSNIVDLSKCWKVTNALLHLKRHRRNRRHRRLSTAVSARGVLHRRVLDPTNNRCVVQTAARGKFKRSSA
jgi:hypothetical protein